MSDIESSNNSYIRIADAPLTFVTLAVAMGGSLATAIAVSGKIVSILGFTPAATVIAYSLTFVCTDAISEIFGKLRAKQVVYAGIIAQLLTMALILAAIRMPSAEFWENQEAFETIMSTSARVTIASIFAYIVSQLHDVWAFHFWRRLTHGKHLWLRNNMSTMSSQAIDTVIFITIAFVGIYPIGPIILGQFVVKLLIAAIDTPIVYAIVLWTRSSVKRVA